MGTLDTVRQLVLDRSAGDMSGAANYAAAVADATALASSLDCERAEYVDITVKITNAGSGPLTKIFIVGRCSGAGQPDILVPTDFSTVNTESVDTATGLSTVIAYQIEMLAAVGEYTFTMPVRTRWFAPVIWVDVNAGTRAQVFCYRRA